MGEAAHKRYVDALLRELKYKSHTAVGWRISSVFFGGGTPSFLDAQLIFLIMKELQKYYDIMPDAEISIEANPCTITSQGLDAYINAGINRISIGCQSVDNERLRLLGRLHDFEGFINSYETALACGFKNINVDLIYGIPGQSPDDWLDELHTVAALDIKHLSAYCLTLEEGTPLYNMRETLDFPSDDDTARMYEDTAAELKKYGFFRYEISNYAKKGCECRHNLGYWRGTPYLGFGIAAASYFNNIRYTNTCDMDEYIKYSDTGRVAKDLIKLTPDDNYSEFMILGLRLTKGISCSEFKLKFDVDIRDVFSKELSHHINAGTLISCGDRIYIPEKYLFVSNSILADFVR